MSLRRRLAAVLLLSGLLAVIGFSLCGISLRQMVQDKDRVTSQYFDAAQLANRHVLAQVDQETGLRGYELSGDPSFLQPYQDGVGNEIASYQQLNALLLDEPESLAVLQRSREAAERWRAEYAQPRLALVAREGRFPLSREELREGKLRFDEVRATSDQLNGRILTARDAADRQLTRATRLLTGVLILAAVGTLLAGVLLWRALLRWVTRPVDRMGADVEVVRGGGLHHAIIPDGPKELADLGRAVEHMRRQVVAEYAAAISARSDAEASARTVQEQALELRRSNRDLEQFAYVASHDLQEPLRKVSAFCQMLQRRYQGQLDEKADQYIAFAVDGAKRMQTLINDLLTFSRVGRSTNAFGEVNLQLCLDEALRVLEGRITESGATVTADPMPVVRGEGSLLTQLFQNLIGNAMKFRSPEAPTVHLEVSRGPVPEGEGEGEEWLFSCTDNGIGIDPQYAEKIFVIFQRLHTKEEFSGTGIGLALCKKIVEYHGGRIWLDTGERTTPGTTLRWSLPVAVASQVPQPRAGGDGASSVGLRQDGSGRAAGRDPGSRRMDGQMMDGPVVDGPMVDGPVTGAST